MLFLVGGSQSKHDLHTNSENPKSKFTSRVNKLLHDNKQYSGLSL